VNLSSKQQLAALEEDLTALTYRARLRRARRAQAQGEDFAEALYAATEVGEGVYALDFDVPLSADELEALAGPGYVAWFQSLTLYDQQRAAWGELRLPTPERAA